MEKFDRHDLVHVYCRSWWGIIKCSNVSLILPINTTSIQIDTKFIMSINNCIRIFIIITDRLITSLRFSLEGWYSSNIRNTFMIFEFEALNCWSTMCRKEIKNNKTRTSKNDEIPCHELYTCIFLLFHFKKILALYLSIN